MSNRSKTFLLIFVDSCILFLLMVIVVYLRTELIHDRFLHLHLKLFSLIFPIWILVYLIEGLYTLRTYNPTNLPISIIRGTSLSVLFSISAIYILPHGFDQITPKTNLLMIAVLSIPSLYVWRNYFFIYFGRETRLQGTILIGSNETLQIVQHELKRKPYLGFKIVGTHNPDIESLPNLNDVQLIAVERNLPKDSKVYKQIFEKLGEVDVIDLAKFAEKTSGKIPLSAIDQSWFIEHCGHQDSRSYDVIKDLIDRTLAIILMVALFPLFLLLFPILLLVHGKPIFFKQVRTGLNNKPFTIYKLRTMVVDAEKSGAQWSKPGDARITPLGKILRMTRMDELPQLINILNGEMSLVGPRPERPEVIEKELTPQIPYYQMRHLVKPGVTGWAQVLFRYGFSAEDSREKLQYDLYYVKNRSIWLDFLVILKTIKTVISGAGQ